MRLLAVLIVLAGAGLRCFDLPALALGHWDAGTYTAGALGVGPYGKHSLMPFYAPPLVPALHQALFALWGVSLVPVLVLHALVGTLTIAAVLAFGRQLLGAGPALMAAAALAGMEYHVVYSREPLTDALFTLWFVLALWVGWRALASARWWPWLLLGLLVSLASWTKYHGPFALLVVAVMGLVRRRQRESDEGACVPCGLVLAGALVALSLAGLAAWIHQQVGWSAFVQNRAQWLPSAELYRVKQTALFVGQALVHWVSPVVLLVAAWGALRSLRRGSGPAPALLWTWLLLYGAALMAYRHYPRLLLPLLPAVALFAGAGLDDLLRRALPGRAIARTAAGMLLLFVPGLLATLDNLQPRPAYGQLARFLADAERPRDARPDLLVTQHAALFDLAGASHPFVCYDEPEASELLRSNGVRYLVFDLRQLKAPGFAAALEAPDSPWRLVRSWDNVLPEPFVVNLTDFGLLDRLRDGSATEDERNIVGTLRVFARKSGD